MHKGADWLEVTLADNLRPVEAPRGLWDRIQNPPAKTRTNWRPAWALAMVVPILAVVWYARPSQAIQSSAPAQVRTWVKQRTGLDIPLPNELSRHVRIESARVVNGEVEIGYRVGNRPALLRVSKAADSGDTQQHRFITNTSWTMRGQLYSLAAPETSEGCVLCHVG